MLLHNLLDCATSAKYTIFMLVAWFLYLHILFSILAHCNSSEIISTPKGSLYTVYSGRTNSMTSPSGAAVYGFWWQCVCIDRVCLCIDKVCVCPPHAELYSGHACCVWVAWATCWTHVWYHCWLTLSLSLPSHHMILEWCVCECGNDWRSLR